MDAPILIEVSLRDYLERYHARLEEEMRRWVDTTGRGLDARAEWEIFARSCLRQLDAEDRVLVPFLAQKSPRDGRAIASEHRHLRARIHEVSRAGARLEAAKTLMDELRAHVRHEAGVVAARIDASESPDVVIGLVGELAQKLVGST